MIPFAPQRRLFLLQSLLSALTVSMSGCVPPAIRQGIHRQNGELRVDGQTVGPEAIIRPGNKVATGSGGQTVLVMGEDAFLLGEKTTVTFHPEADPAPTKNNKVKPITSATGFTVHTGKILSVFATGPRTLKVPTAVIGIRGTGIFLHVEPEQDYMCLCYGSAEVRMNTNPQVGEILEAQHHDVPRFLVPGAPMRPAPMLNHTDEELVMLETLVNRWPPFGTTYSTGY